MRKKILIYISLLIFSTVFFANEYIQLEYQVNLYEYFSLVSDYTDNEREILQKYEPLIYGGNIDEAPLGQYYESHDQYVGYVVDYMNALSIELGTAIVSKPMIWEDAINALEKKETDLCDMIPSVKRSQKFAFTDAIYPLAGSVVLPKSNSDIKSVEDLSNQVVAVQREDYAIEHLTQLNIHPKYVYTDSLSQGMSLLYDEKVSAVIGDAPGIRYALNELSSIEDYLVFKTPIYESAAVLATGMDQKEIVPILNKAIFNLKRKGIVGQIQKKWFHITMGTDNSVKQKKSRLSIIVLSFIILNTSLIAFMWNRTLQYSVDQKTKELEFTKKELEMIFDGMQDYLVITDQRFKIKNINASFLSFLDKTKNDLINQPIKVIDVINQALKDIELDKSKKYRGITDCKYNNRYYDIKISEITGLTKEASFFLFLLIDITYEKIEKEKIVQSNKMAAIGQLAAGMAHEIRNPLGIIRNSTYLLKKDIEMSIQQKALSSINKAVKRASDTIENLLKFSRLSSNEYKTIQAKEFLEDIKILCQQALGESAIELIVECDPDLQVRTNPSALRHIIINIVNNGISAIGNQGEVRITCFLEENKLKFSIKDNGCGMDEETRNKIFDPFFTTKDVGEGTGLGLYIVYSEIQKMNGEIYVESEPKKGTTIYLSIDIGGNHV
jgi:polar amino acid transport system substrate-binding protein